MLQHFSDKNINLMDLRSHLRYILLFNIKLKRFAGTFTRLQAKHREHPFKTMRGLRQRVQVAAFRFSIQPLYVIGYCLNEQGIIVTVL